MNRNPSPSPSPSPSPNPNPNPNPNEVDVLYRAELPGLSTVIDLRAGGRRDVLREIVFSTAYTVRV